MKKILPLYFLTITLLITSCNKDKQHSVKFDETHTPRVFAPNLVSTHMAERDAALSPIGNEFYFTVTSYTHPVIVYTKKTSEGWSTPQVAPFSGTYSDLEPHFSPDGSRLYFASNRPLAESGEPKDFDIWYVDRLDTGWSDPVNIGSPINTEANEFYPSITNSGTLYWCAIRKDNLGIGGEDIYYSIREDGQYKMVQALSDSINTPGDEFNAYVARDESYIIFTSSGWGNGYGKGDLWISFKHPNGYWTRTINMGKKVNSSGFEYCPFVSDCGQYLFFTSDNPKESHSKTPTTYNIIKDFTLNPQNKSSDIYITDAIIIDSLRQMVLRF